MARRGERTADQKFRITGQVVERRTRQGLRGLRVEAWDLDTRYHDMLGTDFTDRRGRFEIRFDSSYFGDFAPDRLPDVFFRVLQHDTVLLSSEKEVIRNLADTDTEVTLAIDLPQQPGDAPRKRDRVSGAAARKGVAFVRKSDFRGIRADLGGRFSAARGLAGELLKAKLTGFDLQPLRSSTVRTGAVFDQDVASVQQTLAAREVQVNQVKPFDAASSAPGLLSAALLPERLKPGQRVDLYEQDGRVRYFTVVQEPKPAEQIRTLRAEVETIRGERGEADRRFAELHDEVKTVRETQAAVSPEVVERLRADLAERDRQLASLHDAVKSVREAQAAVSPEVVERLRADLAERDQQIASLHDEVKTVREAQAAFSPDVVGQLQAGLAERDRQIASLHTEVASVKEAQAAVSPDVVEGLRADLAERDTRIASLQTEVTSVRKAQTAVSADAVKALESQIAELRQRLPKK